jgi:hypothetical protein
MGKAIKKSTCSKKSVNEKAIEARTPIAETPEIKVTTSKRERLTGESLFQQHSQEANMKGFEPEYRKSLYALYKDGQRVAIVNSREVLLRKETVSKISDEKIKKSFSKHARREKWMTTDIKRVPGGLNNVMKEVKAILG